MDKILALHDDDLDVVVQPSIGWMKLNEEIKDSGLFFPVVSHQSKTPRWLWTFCLRSAQQGTRGVLTIHTS
jgi:hypothetical protein